MADSPYKDIQVRYQKPEDPVNFKLQKKSSAGIKLQKFRFFLKVFSREKFTIMLIPHNEAKMLHFHISQLTILFFILLFVILIIASALSFQYQRKIENQANNLHTEVKIIHKNLYFFKKTISNISSQMNKIKKDIQISFEAITGNRFKSNLIFNDNYSKLFLFQNYSIANKDFQKLIKLQRDLFSTRFQVEGIKEFLWERRRIIDNTPSIWPVKGQITSLFGYRRDPFNYNIRFHSALDIASPAGTPVRSSAPGVIIQVGYSKSYGKFVKIRHKFGFYSVYAHNSSIAVTEGQSVTKGQYISRVGATGRTTGEHLHYEILIGFNAVNPYLFLYRE